MTEVKQIKVYTLLKWNLWFPLTSAHALVISQHVATRTHTLVGTKGVNTPEGTQQTILGAFVDVWSQEERQLVLLDYQFTCGDVLLCKWLTFTGHHGSGFEAILAQTLEASHHVGAGSISTRVSYWALVGVWRRAG